jgi:hypothetical protein
VAGYILCKINGPDSGSGAYIQDSLGVLDRRHYEPSFKGKIEDMVMLLLLSVEETVYWGKRACTKSSLSCSASSLGLYWSVHRL